MLGAIAASGAAFARDADMMPFGLLRRLLASQSRFGAMANVVALRSLALGVNLGTGLLTAALLGAGGRGEQAALMIPPLFLSSVSTLGLHASLIYNVKADPENGGRYFGTALLLAFCTGMVAVAVGWVIMPYWLRQYSPHIVGVARILLLFTPLMVLAPLLTGALESHSRFGTANRTLYLQSVGTLVILAGLWRLHMLSPIGAAAAYLVPGIPASIYFILKLRTIMRPQLLQVRNTARRLLHYGLRFYGVDVLGAMSSYFDQVLVVTLLGPKQVGTYVVALSLSRVLTILQGAVTSVLFPNVAARPKARVIETVAATMRITILVSIAGCVVLGVAAPPLVLLVYGKSFAGSIAPFHILLVETVVSNAARILYQAYSGTGRPGVVTLFEATGVSVSIVSMILLVPTYGLTAAASCVLLASCVRLICAVAGMKLILRVRMPRLVLTRADLRAMAKS